MITQPLPEPAGEGGFLGNGYLPPGMLNNPTNICNASPRSNEAAAAAAAAAAAKAEEELEGINCSPCCDNDNIRRTFRGIALGQILSICLCGTGVSSQLLSNKGVNAPAAQSFTNYFLLCFVYCTALSCKSGDDSLLEIIKRRGWRYLVLAFIDVEANFMVVYAYQFTNLTSVQILDCSTIPTVLLLSWLFLSVRYLITHIIGVCLCLLGIAILIWADMLDGKGTIGGSSHLLGDGLCLGGALLYAVSNVCQEFLVKQYNRVEYLGMIGLFGSLISGIQLAILEHKNLSKVDWNLSTIGCFAIFGFSMFIFYSLVSYVLQKTSALMLNLATLTADFYSFLFGIFLFKYSFNSLYFVSYIVVIIGSIMYSLKKTEIRDADEPRRVCPCLFLCCCCCECCFEDGESTEGSLNISPLSSATHSCPMHGNSTSQSIRLSDFSRS
ncbi:unnamed protein product [Auanema sp. JU1783]|nr:unnamed protein product [Auanema sp. JU1783]